MTATQETLTILEEPITIHEEPLTNSEEPITIDEESVTMVEPVMDVVGELIIPKRKPGRPVGAKSKEAGKPRKPREKKVIFEEPIEIPYEALPRAIPGSLPIPTEAYDLRTAKMLRLLQMQTDHRKQQKAHVYSSWFR